MKLLTGFFFAAKLALYWIVAMGMAIFILMSVYFALQGWARQWAQWLG